MSIFLQISASRFREALKKKTFPWKNLTSTQKTPEDGYDMKKSLMEVLQNFAQFSIDPNEVAYVSLNMYG